MSAYNLAYRLFHMSIFIVLLIAYAVLVYIVIPEFVEEDKKAMASSYSGYALTIAISLLTFGSMLTEYIDRRAEMNVQTIKGARR
jgi:hypothetical protein